MTPYGQKTNTRPAEDPKARPWKPGGDRSRSAGLPAAALPSSGGCSGIPGPRQNQEPSKENNPRGRKCCKKDPVSRSSYSVMLASHWEQRGRACVRRPGASFLWTESWARCTALAGPALSVAAGWGRNEIARLSGGMHRRVRDCSHRALHTRVHTHVYRRGPQGCVCK